MSDMVEVVIDSIRVSLVSQQQVILLRERHANRYLPIWIGAFEANAIQLALHEVELARPMTHDLMRRILEVLGARLERVEVTALKENTFYGNLVVSHQGRVYNIDARPSDAIALAVRAHVPIFVAREVMEEAAIVPDEGMEQSGEQAPTPPPPESAQAQPAASAASPPSPTGSTPPETTDEDRLSVFADFLEKIDLDDLEKPDSEPDQPEEDDKP